VNSPRRIISRASRPVCGDIDDLRCIMTLARDLGPPLRTAFCRYRNAHLIIDRPPGKRLHLPVVSGLLLAIQKKQEQH
jgi:hypothetical protein